MSQPSASQTMNAAVLVETGRIELRQVPVPPLEAGQVLLRVEACGVCGTDHHIYEGELTEGVRPPVILGHEIAVRVEACGPGVEGLEPGQPAVADPLIGCGHCAACRSGQPNLCHDPSLVGYGRDGGFAQYMTVPAGKVVPMSEAAGRAGGVLCETLACVVNGYDRLGFTAASSAMILGAGTVGLLWLQMIKSSPCRKVVQTEIVEFRRQKARHLGADAVIDPAAEDLAAAAARELPDGADFIIDATGDPGAIEQAVGLLADGGTFLIFGVCPEGSEVRISPFDLYSKQARIVASKMPPATLDRAAALIEAGHIACDEIVTAVLPLSSAADSIAAFNDHRDHQIKVAIDPWA